MYVTYTRIYGWSDYGGESSYQPGYRLENMMWMTLLVYDYIIPGDKIRWEQYLQNTIPDETALMFIPLLAICSALTVGKLKKFENHTLFRLSIKCSCYWWATWICKAVSWWDGADVGRCRRFFLSVMIKLSLPVSQRVTVPLSIRI